MLRHILSYLVLKKELKWTFLHWVNLHLLASIINILHHFMMFHSVIDVDTNWAKLEPNLMPEFAVFATVTRFGPKVGQFGPKWDKSGKFSDQIQYILARCAKMY